MKPSVGARYVFAPFLSASFNLHIQFYFLQIKPGADAVKVHAEATLVFPLIVAETFAKRVHRSL